MVVQYKGQLGNFNYDDTMYKLCKSNETNPRFSSEYLHYIGTETDGNKITFPQGLTDASNLYAGTGVKSPVTMPEGVKIATGMYAGCRDLEHGDNFVPESLTDQSFMYDDCVNLKTPGRISPNAVYATGMYNGCSNLTYVPSIPDATKDIESFCANSGVKTPFAGGKNVENAYGALAYCEQLEGMPADLNPEAMMDDMVTGCTNLQVEEPAPEKKLGLMARYHDTQPVAFDDINFETDEFGDENIVANIDSFEESAEADAKTAQRVASASFVESPALSDEYQIGAGK